MEGNASRSEPVVRDGTRVPWAAFERFERVGHVAVKARASDVFPLLCPVLEYDWIPDWSCTMAWSASGVAEKNAVFFTKETGGKAVWTVVTYEPDSFIEYLLVRGSAVVMRLSLKLTDGDRAADLEWRMLFTVKKGFFARILKNRFSEPKFEKFLRLRERQLNARFSDAP